jgi:hypothetical protein
MIAGPLALGTRAARRTPDFGAFDAADFDAAAFERHLDASPHLAIVKCRYCIRKLQARFFAGDYASAVDAAEQAERCFSTSTAFSAWLLQRAEYHLYAALSRAACCEPMGPDPYAKHREALAAHDRQLRGRAAQRTRQPHGAGRRRDRASTAASSTPKRLRDAIAAREQGCLPDEALAHEMAAAFETARGLTTIAHAYLRSARRCYASWGATAKVRQLEQLHPQLGDEPALLEPTSTIGAPVAQLDLATVLRVSQAVSSEIVLDTLLDTLRFLAVELAAEHRFYAALSRTATSCASRPRPPPPATR